MYVIGIDPGVHGGLCVLDSNGEISALVKMPKVHITDKKKGKTKYRYAVDYQKMFEVIRELHIKYYPYTIYREAIVQLPNMRNISTLIEHCGAIDMAFATLSVPRDTIIVTTPQRWQSSVYKRYGSMKNFKSTFGIQNNKDSHWELIKELGDVELDNFFDGDTPHSGLIDAYLISLHGYQNMNN